MPLPDPTFDPRRYRDILDEALRRVPVHNPEWTNLNDADPGVTLLQLFAFMTESLLYRAELIPARNRSKYLRLLGLGLRAPSAALGLVSFATKGAALSALTLPAEQSLRAGNVPFRTLDGLSVLPVDARAYYKAPLHPNLRAEAEATYAGLYASYGSTAGGSQLSFYETRVFEPPRSGASLPTLDLAAAAPEAGPVADDGRLLSGDGAVWLALLAKRPADRDAARALLAGGLLRVGVVAAAGTEGTVLDDRADGAAPEADLVFEVPDLPAPPQPPDPASASTPTAAYRPLRVTSRSGNLLRAPGTVELDLRPPAGKRLGTWEDLDPLEAGVGELPPSLDQTADAERLITWIRVRVAQTAETHRSQLDARIHWIGINAARVVQRAQVPVERLGVGSGEPSQRVTFSNTPVIADSVRLTVNGELWSAIDDLAAAAPEIPTSAAADPVPEGADDPRVFQLDPESGEVRFGDGARGKRPPAGAVIQAAYAYGGGSAGLVGIDAINRGPAGTEVGNPVPTWGGDAGESVADGERRLPAFIRHRNRLVSADDYREIALATPGVDIARAEPLALVHPEQPEQDSAGAVTLLVVPRNDPEQPRAPRPDALFLDSICRHLEPRRILTTELHVRGPRYVGMVVSVGIDTLPGQDQATVRDLVEQELVAFLSPIDGGFAAAGWPLGKTVEALELWARVSRVEGIAKVNGLVLAETSGAVRERIPLGRLELPHLVAASVGVGAAPALDSVLGAPAVTDPSQPARLPVPVIPEAC